MQTDAVTQITLNPSPSVLPARLPSVFGQDLNRRRLYTIDELPFNAFERAGHRRPATVPAPWLSVQLVIGERAVTARVRRDGELMDLDGTEYPTLTDAERGLYNAGVLAFRVYETEAAGLGLPVGLQWTTHKTPAGNGCRWSYVSAPTWLADTMTVHTIEHVTISDDDRMCPAECPGSTVEPVTLDPADWARCERCRTVMLADHIDDDSGLCGPCEQHNDDRVTL